MATFEWLGGSVLPQQGRYGVASDWYDVTTGAYGAAAPQSGDVAYVAGTTNAGVTKSAALYVFPAGGYPLVEFFAPPTPANPGQSPSAVAGYAVQNQTINVDGTAGAVALWLENSRLLGTTLNVVGTAVVSAYLDDTVTGTVAVGAAATPGFLQVALIPLDTAGVGPTDHHPVTTFDSAVTVYAGSTFDVEAAAPGHVAGFVNSGTITAAPGGTLVFDDTDRADAATFPGPVANVAEHGASLTNAGAIDVEGGVGQTTKAVLLMNTTGNGSIDVDGHGAPRAATTLTVDGNLTGQHLTLADGTVFVNDTSADITSLGDSGFAVTGGSFTFADGHGTLLLRQVSLSTLGSNSGSSEEAPTPNGRAPFTTPISGFRAGDVIALYGKYQTAVGQSYVTSYDPASGVLQVQSPSAVGENPPSIVASFTLVGKYDPTLFQLSGNVATKELDLTYGGQPSPPVVVPPVLSPPPAPPPVVVPPVAPPPVVTPPVVVPPVVVPPTGATPPPLVTLAGSPVGAITNDASPRFVGGGPAGGAVTLLVDGTASGGAVAGADGAWTATPTTPLALGPRQVSATVEAGGVTAASNPLGVLELPAQVGGVSTADDSSMNLARLLGAGYSLSFVPGTEAVQLVNGTLSVGPDTNAAYVQRLYEGLLGRSADAGGLASFSGALDGGADPAAIAEAFLNGDEYQTLHGPLASTGDAQFVISLYEGMLGRAPDPAGLANWTAALAQGATRGQVAAACAQSAEAKTYLGVDTTRLWVPSSDGALVTQLYGTGLDRIPDLAGLQGWTQALAHGLTAAELAQDMVGSAEYQALHAGQDATQLVTAFYQDGLGRAPDAAGLQGWVDALQSGTSQASVLLACATSAEAAAHLSPPL